MFNVHLDTVAGHVPPAFDGRRFTGRGAVDAKGPAVALLAGLRAAASHPAVGRDVTVLLQAVAGEEGGALGTYGTRPLLEAGHHGRLNVFCEPTGLRALPRATASMTARITVTGEDAVDDHPDAGHNATVLLGFLAQHLAAHLDGAVPGARVCLAGLHTGRTHNRVHGAGTLLVNLSYRTTADGRHLKAAVTRHVTGGLLRFTELFASTREFARTARDATDITRLGWDKHGLPALDNGDAWAEALLARAGARPANGDPGFTCDAIWAAGLDDAFTAVLGPGDLATNHAHARRGVRRPRRPGGLRGRHPPPGHPLRRRPPTRPSRKEPRMTVSTTSPATSDHASVLVGHAELHAALTGLFTGHGIPAPRARLAADALCHGDLTGLDSHGVFNLSRLYLPLLESGRCDPRAEPRTVTDLGACAVVDARRALGLWAAAEAMDDAVARARRHGVGLLSVHGATHFGCAGFHAVRAAHAGMIGVVASNCGGQRIARPPGGAVAMLGTNPLSVAAPALDGHPFLLDMSTTVAPTGRVRVAARRGTPVPAGWLEDASGDP